MRSKTHETGTSEVEVSHIGRHGIWLCIKDCEYFPSYQDLPWFLEAKVKDIPDVHLLHGHHLHWPRLDIDLTVDCLKEPHRYPVVSKGSIPAG